MSAPSKSSASEPVKKSATKFVKTEKSASGPVVRPRPGLALRRPAYLYAAVVCFVVFSVVALIQAPRPVPNPPEGIFAFWRYPIVLNDIKRLPAVTIKGSSKSPDLHAVFVLPEDTNQVWLAGDAGTLLHSSDGGKRWTKLPPDASEQKAALSPANDPSPFWSFIPSASAAPAGEPQSNPSSPKSQNASAMSLTGTAAAT